jgi:CRISPR-associated endonuclease/helicase Cas3
VGAKEAEGYSSDPTTRLGRFITLAEHTDHVVAHLEALLAGFPELPPQVVAALLLAARWHDAGKAHPAFQSMLTAALPENDPRRDGTAWAKAPKSPGEDTNERKFFRHELASALAMLPGGLPDLAAYIAASHHGKTRLSIRSMPGERPPDDRPGARVARGIVEGDVLPATDLGGGTAMPETTLSLVSMEMGESDAGQSWLARVLALRDALGPFRLAWLETMLRVADWRASEEEACLNE